MERMKNIGTDKAQQKIKHYCAYQERSHREVKEKLYSFGLYKQEVESLISQLIEDDYLNEERYAVAFAGGKFRMRQWGRVKIRYELKQKGLSEYCIKKALAAIDDNAYNSVSEKLFEQKLKMLKSEKNIFTKKAKLSAYMMQKGYEHEKISALISSMVRNK